MDVQDVSLSATNIVNVQGVLQFIVFSVDVQGVCASFHLLKKCFKNAGMPDCPASGQSGTVINKNAEAGTSPVPEQGDPVRY